jgi:hypothetical protein
MALEQSDPCLLLIAGRKVTLERAERLVRDLPGATVLYYDLGGDAHGWPAPSDGLTLTDIGRAAFLNAEINGTDAARLLDASRSISAGPASVWEAVPHWATLEMADPTSLGGLYDAALALHDHFHKIRGIGPAKASKLLQLKRPSLYPILDSRVMDLYRATGAPAAAAKANPRSRDRGWKEVFWDAIRDDLIANRRCLSDLHQILVAAGANGDEKAALLGRLGPLRLLDVILSRLPASRARAGRAAT